MQHRVPFATDCSQNGCCAHARLPRLSLIKGTLIYALTMRRLAARVVHSWISIERCSDTYFNQSRDRETRLLGIKVHDARYSET